MHKFLFEEINLEKGNYLNALVKKPRMARGMKKEKKDTKYRNVE